MRNKRKLKGTVHYAKDAAGHFIQIPIREVRPDYYMIDLVRAGKRERKCFSDIEQARVWCQQKAIEIMNEGLAVFRLNDEQKRDALKALELLKGRAKLVEVAQEWVKRNPDTGGKTVLRACAEYLFDMKKSDCRRVSIMEKRQKFRLFCVDYGKSLIEGLDVQDMAAWCDSKGYHGTNRDNYMRALKALLNFAKGNKRQRRKRDERLPDIMKPEEVERLFRKANKRVPEIVPMLTVLFFCGLRPHEAMRLKWSDINLEDRLITISAEITKTRTVRTVEIPDNAVLWLAATRKKSGLLSETPNIYRKRRERLMKLVKMEEWPPDVTRHTFATAHYWHHQDAGKTMTALGHFANVATFIRHYKSLMTPSESKRFWEIKPQGPGKIIKLNAASA
jgi:integrase